MSDNVQYEAGERLSVTLRRPESSVPWGFRLQGGIDFSTQLSVQVVQPHSVAERLGLESGDGIEMINGRSASTLTHEEAKKEIIRSGNEIAFIIVRGAVRIWKPQVTPMSELKPSQLNMVHTATGDHVIPVQKTSLARPQQESLHIGSSHNRAARPFGGDAPVKQATATVVHSQFNSPIGLYSADNIAQTYSSQTRGISDQVQGLDLSDRNVGSRMSGGTYQEINPPQGDEAPTEPFVSDLSLTDNHITNNVHETAQHDTSVPCTNHVLPQETTVTITSRLSDPSTDVDPSPKVSDSFGSDGISQSRSFYQVETELSEQEAPDDASCDGGPSGFRSVRAPDAKPGGQQANKPSLSRCYACDMLITGVFVKASGQPYHVQCLKCTTCGMNLKQKGFIVVDEKLYCDVHAKRVAQPPGSGMVAVPTFQ